MQTMTHQSERLGVISHYFHMNTVRSNTRNILRTTGATTTQDNETPLNIMGGRNKQKKKLPFSSSSSSSSLSSLPTFLPLTWFMWNWKTQVWKGGIYKASHALIKTVPGTVCMYACMHVCMCVRTCTAARVLLAWQTTQYVTSLYPPVHGHMAVTSAARPRSHDPSRKFAHDRHKWKKANLTKDLRKRWNKTDPPFKTQWIWTWILTDQVNTTKSAELKRVYTKIKPHLLEIYTESLKTNYYIRVSRCYTQMFTIKNVQQHD